MIVQAISRRTGRNVATFYAGGPEVYTVLLNGGSEPGPAGPFDRIFWDVASLLLARKFSSAGIPPTVDQALMRGLITPAEVAAAMPEEYGPFNLIRGR